MENIKIKNKYNLKFIALIISVIIMSALFLTGCDLFSRKYTVTFYGLNNDIISTIEVKQNSNAILPSSEECEIDGYTFIGWHTDAVSITKNTNIYGIYSKDSTIDINTYFQISSNTAFAKDPNNYFSDLITPEGNNIRIDEIHDIAKYNNDFTVETYTKVNCDKIIDITITTSEYDYYYLNVGMDFKNKIIYIELSLFGLNDQYYSFVGDDNQSSLNIDGTYYFQELFSGAFNNS